MPEVEIRAAEPGDVEAIHQILRCPGVVANTLQLPWRALQYSRERFSLPRPDEYLLVGLVEGRVVGNIGLQIVQTPRRRDVGDLGMSVHDEFQGQGVGSALMAAVLELADNWLGLRRIELTVWSDNARAIHLYEKYGFQHEGTARQYARRAGELVDAHFMARLRD